MPIPTTNNILQQRLDALAYYDWLPQPLWQLASQTLHAQNSVICALPTLALPAHVLAGADNHRQGQPLLAPADFPFDTEGAARLWQTLHAALLQAGGPTTVAAMRLQAHAALTPQAAFVALCADTPDAFAVWEQATPEAPHIGRFLAQNSLMPWTMFTAQALTAQRHDAIWTFGHCPCCGRLPFIGQLRGNEGQRWHICAFCQHDYRAMRLQCPVCLETDTTHLRSFTVDTVPGYTVCICNTCTYYLKLRHLHEYNERENISALDDIESLPLDIVAQKQGLQRIAPSLWAC